MALILLTQILNLKLLKICKNNKNYTKKLNKTIYNNKNIINYIMDKIIIKRMINLKFKKSSHKIIFNHIKS